LRNDSAPGLDVGGANSLHLRGQSGLVGALVNEFFFAIGVVRADGCAMRSRAVGFREKRADDITRSGLLATECAIDSGSPLRKCFSAELILNAGTMSVGQARRR